MTVSHLNRSRDQLWSDLLVALGGSEAFLSRSISERRILLEIMETFSVTVSTKDIDDLDELLEQVVIAAGGSASHLRQNKHEMLAELVTALGGTPPSASSSSTGELLAACVNAADTGGGGGYVASAVHFDGATTLVNNAVTCTDSFDVSCVFWFKTSALGGGNALLCSDPDSAANNILALAGGDFDFELGDVPFVNTIEPNLPASFNDGAWHCAVFSANTNHVPASCIAVLYIDDILQTLVLHPSGSSAFKAAFNGLKMVFGTDGGAPYTGDLSDFRLYAGTSLLTGNDISLSTRRLFRDANGKPVDPATATASLGSSGIIFFSGDATAFATNQGTGGAFSFTAGSLTNATTSPSD